MRTLFGDPKGQLAKVEEQDIHEAQALGRHVLRALIWAMYAMQRERMDDYRPEKQSRPSSSDNAAHNSCSSSEEWED